MNPKLLIPDIVPQFVSITDQPELFLVATKRLCKSVCPSVRRSVMLSVTLSLFGLLGATYVGYTALFFPQEHNDRGMESLKAGLANINVSRGLSDSIIAYVRFSQGGAQART